MTSQQQSQSQYLPDLLELTLHLSDSVRLPGDTLQGTICISIPTKKSLKLLHGIDEDMIMMRNNENIIKQDIISSSSSTPSTSSRSINSTSTSNNTAASSLLTPLSNPFSFLLKFQLIGRVLYDNKLFDSKSLLRFKPNNL